MKYSTFLSLSVILAGTAAQAVPFQGSALGSWSNPDATFGYSIANNDNGGVARVEWGSGDDGPSLWTFDGAGSDGGPGWSAEAGEVFQIGSFSYANSPIATTSHNFSGADLDVDLNITSPLGVNQSFTFEFDVINTPNTTGDPVADGDQADIINNFGPTTFTYDGQEYTLMLLGFSTDGGATLVDRFNIAEGDAAKAGLYGQIIPPSEVPLPAGLPLFLGALGLLGVMRARKHTAEV